MNFHHRHNMASSSLTVNTGMLKKYYLGLSSLLLVFCFFHGNDLIAGPKEDFQTWGTVTAIGSLDAIDPDLSKYRYWLEGQGRFGNDTSQVSQGMLRTGLGYALSETLTMWLGYAFIPTEEPFVSEPFDEHRNWQQLLWNQPFSFGTFSSRSRLEQRFMQIGNDVGWRYRQLFKISLPLTFAPNFSLVATNEVFIDINKTDWKSVNGFDQNRAFAGIGYNFDEHIRTEIGYMNQYIYKATAQDFMSHIISINWYLNF
jgi:hypothetical protein